MRLWGICIHACLLVYMIVWKTGPAAAARAGSLDCGKQGQAACGYSCTAAPVNASIITAQQSQEPWCPSHNVTSSGCIEGLARVTVTPDIEQMPDLCLVLPVAGKECGLTGQPCCLSAAAGEGPSDNIRAQCDAGLSCIVTNTGSIPYGSSRHMHTILARGNNSSSGLLAEDIMGSCRDVASQHQDVSGHREPGTSLWQPCDYTRPCPEGSYCAGNEDHYLGTPRCLPLPPCGGLNQRCCPPNSNGVFEVYSITNKQTPMPYCTDPASVCLWQPPPHDLSLPRSQNDLEPRPPQASYSMSVTFPFATCIPNLQHCGKAGQPCCPHAQFAVSNSDLYFRTHVCDPGLKCDATISLFGPAQEEPVLGVCRGEPKACGQVGQPCCKYKDQAGWDWKTCGDGQPGVYCHEALNVCKSCPSGSTRISAAEAAAIGSAC